MILSIERCTYDIILFTILDVAQRNNLFMEFFSKGFACSCFSAVIRNHRRLNLIGPDYIHDGNKEIACKDKEIGPKGSKVDPPGDLQSLLLECVLLALLHGPPGWPDRVAGQQEGLAVGQEGHEDGVDGGEEEGEGAAAQQCGHQGGLGEVVGVDGERDE